MRQRLVLIMGRKNADYLSDGQKETQQYILPSVRILYRSYLKEAVRLGWEYSKTGGIFRDRIEKNGRNLNFRDDPSSSNNIVLKPSGLPSTFLNLKRVGEMIVAKGYIRELIDNHLNSLIDNHLNSIEQRSIAELAELAEILAFCNVDLPETGIWLELTEEGSSYFHSNRATRPNRGRENTKNSKRTTFEDDGDHDLLSSGTLSSSRTLSTSSLSSKESSYGCDDDHHGDHHDVEKQEEGLADELLDKALEKNACEDLKVIPISIKTIFLYAELVNNRDFCIHDAKRRRVATSVWRECKGQDANGDAYTDFDVSNDDTHTKTVSRLSVMRQHIGSALSEQHVVRNGLYGQRALVDTLDWIGQPNTYNFGRFRGLESNGMDYNFENKVNSLKEKLSALLGGEMLILAKDKQLFGANSALSDLDCRSLEWIINGENVMYTGYEKLLISSRTPRASSFPTHLLCISGRLYWTKSMLRKVEEDVLKVVREGIAE